MKEKKEKKMGTAMNGERRGGRKKGKGKKEGLKMVKEEGRNREGRRKNRGKEEERNDGRKK